MILKEVDMTIIKSPTTKEEFKAYYALRYRVLYQPWGQPKGSEKDDYEPISNHFMAIDEKSGEIIGVVKLFEKSPDTGQFSHMAVLESRQRQGIGELLMHVVEDAARQKGYQHLGIMTHLTSTGFFEKFGYLVKGIPSHYFGTTQMVWMEKDIPISI